MESRIENLLEEGEIPNSRVGGRGILRRITKMRREESNRDIPECGVRNIYLRLAAL